MAKKRGRNGQAEPKESEGVGRRPGRHRPTEARKLRALPLLVAGWKHSQIAAEIGVTSRTIERWIAEDELFAQALKNAASETEAAIDGTRKLLESLGLASVLALADAVERGDASAAARVLTMIGVATPKKLEHGVSNETAELLTRVGEILAKKRRRENGEGDE